METVKRILRRKSVWVLVAAVVAIAILVVQGSIMVNWYQGPALWIAVPWDWSHNVQFGYMGGWFFTPNTI